MNGRDGVSFVRLFYQIHNVVFTDMIIYLEADALACRGLVNMPVFILHRVNGLGKIGDMAFYVNLTAYPERTFVYLDHGNAEMAVVMGCHTKCVFVR